MACIDELSDVMLAWGEATQGIGEFIATTYLTYQDFEDAAEGFFDTASGFPSNIASAFSTHLGNNDPFRAIYEADSLNDGLDVASGMSDTFGITAMKNYSKHAKLMAEEVAAAKAANHSLTTLQAFESFSNGKELVGVAAKQIARFSLVHSISKGADDVFNEPTLDQQALATIKLSAELGSIGLAGSAGSAFGVVLGTAAFGPGGAIVLGAVGATLAAGFVQNWWNQNGDDVLDGLKAAKDAAVSQIDATDAALAAMDDALDAFFDGSVSSGVDAIVDIMNLGIEVVSSIATCLDELSDWVEDVLDKILDAILNGSPLVVDVDKDGIELISLDDSLTRFDLTEDGFAERAGWVSADDAFLAIDLNENGEIDSAAELFGSVDTDGFTQLAVYDSNGDGVIDANDAVWDDLILWRDLDLSGTASEGEFFTMDDYDIVSIDLAGVSEVSYQLAGHDVSHESTVTFSDMSTSDIVDVWFDYNSTDTVYVGDYTPDEDVYDLPLLRGFGTIKALHMQASIDNDDMDSDSLISLLTNLSDLTFSTIFDETSDTSDIVLDIMCRWAEVDDVASDSRGPNIDARKLEFLEEFSGQEFVQTASAYQSDPGPNAANDLEEAFEIAFNNIYGRLLTQAAGGELFSGDFYYNITTDAIEGVTGLDATNLAALETEATALSTTGEREVFWQNVVRMVDYSVGITNLPSGDQTALDDAIYDSDNSLDLATILAGTVYVGPDGSTYNGTSSNDTLTDGSGNDTLNGQEGNDTLSASDGNDELNGGSGDDVLEGGVGNDYLLGGTGDDEYHWDAGDGHDIIKEDGTGTGNDDDRIMLGSGFDSGDLTITRISNNGLMIEMDNGTDTGSILIEDQFNTGNGHVELIEFSDSSTYTLDDKNYTLTGTDGADQLFGVNQGGADADTIYGGAGNDEINGFAPNQNNDSATNTLYGEAGDDEINGGIGTDNIYGGADNDTLDGNAGDDVLSGGSGNDTYHGDAGDDEFVYTGGHDVMEDSTGTADKITLDASYDSVTPDYYRFDDDLQIYWDADNTITITDFYSGNSIETMVYDDTTTVTLSSVSAVTQGTSAGETLSGTSGDDLLYGNGGDDTVNSGSGTSGNDTVYGGTGDDEVNGGYGDDYLDGGAGDDEYYGGPDNDTFFYVSGHDYMDEASGTDILEIAAGWEWEDLTFKRYEDNASDLWIEINGSNSIELNNQFTSSGSWETLRMNDGTGDVALTTMVFTTYGTTGGDYITGINNGGSEDDIIYGLAGGDTINGNDGDDILYGGDGNDDLRGKNDDDIMYGGAGDDEYDGGYGNDTFVYSEGLDYMEDNSGTETLLLTGGITVDDITISDLGSYDATIVINSGTDEIDIDNLRHGSSTYHIETIAFDDGFEADLPSYNSWMTGNGTSDLIASNATAHVMLGYGGDDTLQGNGGNDTMHGGAGADTLEGGDDDDFMHGGIGDDLLYGEDGLDTLFGGSGSDTFFLEDTTAFNDIDVIKDFDVATDDDVLDISDILDNTSYVHGTDDIEDWLEITDSGSDSVVKIDTTGAGSFGAGTQVATLEGITGLTDEQALVTSGNLIAA